MKILLCLLLVVPAAHCFQKEDRQEIRKTLKFQDPSGERRVMIDNIEGSITVEGYDGNDVELSAIRSTRYESDERLKEATEDVTLDMKETRDRIEVTVEVPWRDCRGGIDQWGYRFYGYEVSFDFTVKVPRNAEIYLRTVNEGEIRVRGVNGDFEVRNVNGNVVLKDMGGSGRAGTVNGSLDVTFAENPRKNCAFQTVNGTVTIALRDPLSADLMFKTFNGNAYTDFDFSALPSRPGTIKERHGMKVYRSGDDYTVRVGAGGPKLAFDTLNGDINVVKHQ